MIPLGITASASLHGHGTTSFTVDSHDEAFAQTLVSFFLRFKEGGNITEIDTTRSNDGATVAIGSNTQAGDIALLIDSASNNNATTMPTTVLPSGFTSIVMTEFDTSNEFKTISSFKILDASDISTGTLTGMVGEMESKILFTFRCDSTPTITSGSINTYTDSGNPSAQTVNISGVGRHPVVIGALKLTRSTGPITDQSSFTTTDGLTKELTSAEFVTTSSRHMLRAGYYMNNNGVYNELINTNVSDIVLYNSFDTGNSSSVGNFNSVTQKTYLSAPGATQFTISNNTWEAQEAGNTGVGNEESTSNIPQIVNQNTLGDGSPRLLNYITTLKTLNASVVEPNIGSGTWHDYLDASFWDTLSIEMFFYLESGANAGSSTFPRIFDWGDPNNMVNNSGANGFGFEMDGSSSVRVDGYLYVDENVSNRTQILNSPTLNKNEWYYIFMGVDKANGTCCCTLSGRNRFEQNTFTPTGAKAIPTTWTPKAFPIKFGQRINTKEYDGGICDLVVRINDPNYAFKHTNGADPQTNLQSFLGTLTD